MARYQIPPDPRENGEGGPHARKIGPASGRSSPPWLWIGLGAIVTVLAIAVAVLWARLLLDVQPAEVDATPTVILLTAVPTTPAPTETPAAPEPTPTQAPATPEQPGTGTEVEPTVAPTGEISMGASVVVVGTGGAGVSLRAGPGTENARLAIGNDGDVLEVIGGPDEGGGFVWWFVRAADGSEGWVVEDFLQAE